MCKAKAILVLAASAIAAAVANAHVVRDIPYDPDIGASGLGDLYLPEKVTPETPVVLAIHGGGWGSGDRYSWSGVAEFFCRDLGCVAFNIEYRLASKANPWPACGDDCVKAANWLFSDAFRKLAGFTPRKIYVCGGSAGGHLALWTLVSMPLDKMAGCISISAIGDPLPNFRAYPGGYRTLLGAKADESSISTMNPVLKIKPGMAPLLCTHATEDKVVAIESHRAFADAYRAAGNECDFFEYPGNVQPGLTGHCIWIPGSKPHRLIPSLETRIAAFMGRERKNYVPEPQPVRSAVEITALYYPGTEHMPEWDMVVQTRPEIKPLLGWYDEGNPEVIDWQIKWAVEHGITSFSVDWYWNRGRRRLEHWVKAYYKARYRKYLKWYMMYANHNQPGAHSTEDQIAVTKYWIDNYFKTPEYYKIDGKPVVCYWSDYNLNRDFIAEAAAHGETLTGDEGIRRAFAISEKMVKDAGLPGIHWQFMWNNTVYDPVLAADKRDVGYASSISYGFVTAARALAPKAAARAEGLTYDMVMEAMPRLWWPKAVQKELPWWLPIPAGWDVRPRDFADAVVIRGRTPEKLAAICREARAFCDRNGLRHVIVHPLNEWQEGTYIEPNEEFGFAMYDALRDAFCEKPAAGWPANLVPKDVGLGPYDYPPVVRSSVPRWEFDSGSTEGWYRQPSGSAEVACGDDGLGFVTTGCCKYNIRQRMVPFPSSRYGSFRVRMRITPNPVAGLSGVEGSCPAMRLKWGTTDEPVIGKGLVVDAKRCVASCPVQADGEWHEYELPLAGRPDWKGDVDELWFEAVNARHARVAIDWMRFE